MALVKRCENGKKSVGMMELKKEKGPVEYNKRGSLQFSQCNEPFYCKPSSKSP